jgi:hypothetical protein
MMRIPAQWHEFAEFVRRALHDAAESLLAAQPDP